MGCPLVPKGGALLPPPHAGEVQPSQLSHPSPKITPAPTRERWQEREVERGHPVALFGVVSHPCPFRPQLCSRFGLLVSTGETVTPGRCLLCKASGCCRRQRMAMGKERAHLHLALVKCSGGPASPRDPAPGFCGLGASCTWGQTHAN